MNNNDLILYIWYMFEPFIYTIIGFLLLQSWWETTEYFPKYQTLWAFLKAVWVLMKEFFGDDLSLEIWWELISASPSLWALLKTLWPLMKKFIKKKL